MKFPHIYVDSMLSTKKEVQVKGNIMAVLLMTLPRMLMKMAKKIRFGPHVSGERVVYEQHKYNLSHMYQI